MPPLRKRVRVIHPRPKDAVRRVVASAAAVFHIMASARACLLPSLLTTTRLAWEAAVVSARPPAFYTFSSSSSSSFSSVPHKDASSFLPSFPFSLCEMLRPVTDARAWSAADEEEEEASSPTDNTCGSARPSNLARYSPTSL